MMKYSNSRKVYYASFNRIENVRYDAETNPRYEYAYGSNGALGKVADNNLARTAETKYDLANRPIETIQRDASGTLIYRTSLDYDDCHIEGCTHDAAAHCAYNAKNNLTQFKEQVGAAIYVTNYAYDKDDRVTQAQYGDTAHKVMYAYDGLGRVAIREAYNGSSSSAALTSEYSYVEGGYSTATATSQTPLVSGIDQEHIGFAYTYDAAGNITSEIREYKNTTPHTYKTTSYAYDALGQLIRVNDQNDTTSGNTGTTWTYLYDRGGNILSKSRYAYTAAGTNVGTAIETISYTYGDSGWKDKLTAYNGTTITYDNIGNPLNDGTWTYTWTAGRQLTQMSKTGMTVQFKYDHNGLRTQKIVTENGVTTTTNYILHGKLLTHMTRGTDNLHFRYDAQSRPAEVEFNGTKYTYIHNLQGDIVGLTNSAGTLVVEYRYDAWGKLLGTTGTLATTLGARNPFRYRGYVYDEETELYYLRSRYYFAICARFICSDNYIGSESAFKSHNIFYYCVNNPISNADHSGHSMVYIIFKLVKYCIKAMKDLSIKADEYLKKTHIFGNILITNYKLYKIYNPRDHQEIVFSLMPKVIATGQGSCSKISLANFFLNLGTYDMSALSLLSILKDSVLSINVKINIAQTGDLAPEACVMAQMYRNYTDIELDVNPINKVEKSELVYITRAEGHGFWFMLKDGREIYVDDTDDLLNDLLESIVLE